MRRPRTRPRKSWEGRPRTRATLALVLALFAWLGCLGPALAQPVDPGRAAPAAPAPAAPAAPAPAVPAAPAPGAPSAPSGDRFQALFQEGNQQYLSGDYNGAVATYRKLVDSGLQHPDVYFNLGNAYYRAGFKGLAVLFYERALTLDPNDSAVLSNLETVRKELIDRVVMPGEGGVGDPLWHEFVRGLGLGRLTWIALGLYWLFFGLLAARVLLGLGGEGPVRRLLFWISIPVLSLALVAGGLLASRIWLAERVHHAVVVAPAAALREGPERSAKSLMEVHEGLKVRLLSSAGDHVRVRLENGVEGFLAESQIGRI
jgi:hypothetical protein